MKELRAFSWHFGGKHTLNLFLDAEMEKQIMILKRILYDIMFNKIHF